MNCNETHALLSAYRDGELGLESSLAIEGHLAQCADCAAAQRRGHALSSALVANAIDYRCPAAVRDSVEAAIRQAIPTSLRQPEGGGPRRRPCWPWPAAAWP